MLFGLVTQSPSASNDVAGGGRLRDEPKERLHILRNLITGTMAGVLGS